MEEVFLKYIMTHCCFIEFIDGLTVTMLNESRNKNQDYVINEVENKQRAINAMAEIQKKIETILTTIPRPISSEIIEILRLWTDEFSLKTALWNNMDIEISRCLEIEKEVTTQELASSFKTKELFKGYNLANVKK